MPGVIPTRTLRQRSNSIKPSTSTMSKLDRPSTLSGLASFVFSRTQINASKEQASIKSWHSGTAGYLQWAAQRARPSTNERYKAAKLRTERFCDRSTATRVPGSTRLRGRQTSGSSSFVNAARRRTFATRGPESRKVGPPGTHT